MKMKKLLSLLLVLVLVLSLLPMTALADGENVRVIIENTTFTTAAQSADGQTAPAWSGTLLDTQVSAYQDMTMMEAIGAALTAHGYTAEGLYSGYISSINGLAEKEGLGQNSGWMGTLNDWFVNEGFSNFTVGNGDVVRVMYTNANSGGTDLGGTWDNNVKSLSALGISAGALTPSFSAGTPNYTLTLPAGTNSVTVTPAAMNKNFQVRVKTDAEGFDAVRWGARTLSVINGDTITVTCGDPTWPSMNNGAPPTGNYAELVPAGSYTITVSIDNPAPVSAQTPVFFTDLSATPVAYDAGQTAIPLTAAAVVTDGGTVTYQWYSSTNNVDFYPMGETGTSLMPSTVTAGTTYYYVIATNTLGESAASATSQVACVTVTSSSVETPSFTTDLSTDPVTYTVGQTATALTVAASVTDGGTVTYQWYGSADNVTFAPLDNAQSDTYTPSTEATGTTYYYVIASNTKSGDTATATSRVACVTVTAASVIPSVQVMPTCDGTKLGSENYWGTDVYLVTVPADAQQINFKTNGSVKIGGYYDYLQNAGTESLNIDSLNLALSDGFKITEEILRDYLPASIVDQLNTDMPLYAYTLFDPTWAYYMVVIVQVGTPVPAEQLNAASILSVANGSVTVQLDKVPESGTPGNRLFNITLTPPTGSAYTVKVKNVSLSGDTVTLSFDPVTTDSTSEQTYSIAVSYTGQALPVPTGAFTVVSLDWSKYAQKPTNGDGSASAPYRIGTAEELAWFAGLVNGTLTDGTAQSSTAHAVLTADITLNDTTGWESWDENTPGLRLWRPIGFTSYTTFTQAYKGVFDGKGHTISGLYISYPKEDFNIGLGLFDKAFGATIKNVRIVKSYIQHTSSEYVGIGGVLNQGTNVTLENCYTAMRLIGGKNCVGGIAGMINTQSASQSSKVTGCISNSTIVSTQTNSSTQNICGGVVAYSDFFNASSYGITNTVSDCYFTGSITRGVSGVSGGIVGKVTYVHYSYMTDAFVAGTINRCYSVGTISGGVISNGITNILGMSDLNVPADDLSSFNVATDCYYLSGGAAGMFGTAKTESELKDSAILTLLGDAYNFVDGRNSGYPMLKWQTAATATQVEIPAFTLTNDDGLGTEITVAISCATDGATIYYTTDGTDPTTNSAVYSAPFTILGGSIRAFAVKEGLDSSAINTASVSFVVAPAANPGSSTLTQAADVTLSSGTAGAAIYYTTDGTEPIDWDQDSFRYVLGSTAVLYNAPISVTTDTIIKAAAIKQGMCASESSTFTYAYSWTTDVQQPQGAGTSDSPYLIGKAQELAWFAAMINGELPGVIKNTAACAKLTANIDLLDAHTWKAIASFAGVFDGDGHTVVNLNFAASATGSMFGSNSGTIKNVGTIGRSLVSSNQSFAVLCSSNSGTVSGCWNDVDIDTWGQSISGLVGGNAAAGVIEFCYNTGDIIGKDDPYGGTSGVTRDVGGICGTNNGVVRDCYNTGVFTSMRTYGYAWGGICGALSNSGSLLRCYDMGMFTSGKSSVISTGDWGGWCGSHGNNCGLIAGYEYNPSGNIFNITDCYYLENLTLTGNGLTNVPLSRLYWANNDNFAGFKIAAADILKIDGPSAYNPGSTYYAFYDVTNDQIIGVKLAGADDDDGHIALDAKNLSIDCSFAGMQGQYMSTTTKTINIVTVPANTTHITFTNTEKIQDFTFYLYDENATKINSGNVSAVLAQAQSTWPAQYANIAATVNRYMGDTAYVPISGTVRVIIENTTFTDASQSNGGQTAPTGRERCWIQPLQLMKTAP